MMAVVRIIHYAPAGGLPPLGDRWHMCERALQSTSRVTTRSDIVRVTCPDCLELIIERAAFALARSTIATTKPAQ